MIDMKDHLIAKIHNDLRDTAVKYHNFQCIREKLAKIISPLVQESQRVEKALKILDLMHKELPHTMGEPNMQLIYDDVWDAIKALRGD